MALTYTPALPKPANFVASAAAGGSIALGTYYIRVVAVELDNFANGVRSPASDEKTVVLSGGNQSLNLSWDAVVGAGYYNVYITTLGSGVATRWYYKKQVTSSWSHPTTDQTSILITALNLQYNHDIFAYPYTMPGGLDKELGIGRINIAGDVGDITLQDLADIIDSGYVFYNAGLFAGLIEINVEQTAVGSLTLDYGDELKTMGDLRYETTNIDTFQLNMSGAIINLIKYGYNFRLINSSMNKTEIRGNRGGIGGVQYALQYTGMKPYLGTMMVGYDNYLNVYGTTGNENTVYGIIVQNAKAGVVIDGWNFIDGQFWGYVYFPLTLINSKINYFQWRNSLILDDLDDTDYLIKNCKIISIRHSYVNGITRYYNCYTEEDPPNRPDIYFSPNPSVWIDTDEWYKSLNLTIRDNAGNGIKDVAVKLYDKNSLLLFDVLTDVDGKIVEQNAMIARFGNNGGAADDLYVEDFNPFTMIITKEGYIDYTAEIGALTEPIDWEITLQPYTYVDRDLVGDVDIIDVEGELINETI